MSENQNSIPVANSGEVVESTEQSLESSDNTAEALEGQEESSEEGTEIVADADAEESEEAPKKETKAEKDLKKQLKKLKLKVDGKEIDEEFDLSDDDYLTKQLQLAKVAQKRMSEYSTLEKEVRSFIEDLRKDPRKVLSDPNIGVDMKKLAASVIEDEIATSQKSPEQIEKEKLESELRTMKEEREKEKEEKKQLELEQLQAKESQRYQTLMNSALEKSDLPKSPYIIKKMANYMLLGLQKGLDVNPEDVLPLVREEMHNDLKEMFAVMPDEVVEALVGKDVISRIRKKSIAKGKGTPPVPVNKSITDVGKTAPKEDSGVKKSNYKQFFGV